MVKGQLLPKQKLITLLLLILAAFSCHAKKTTYVIGVENTNHFPLYDNDNGEYIGFSRALLDQFAASQNINFVYKVLPVERLFRVFLNANELDFKFPDNPNWRTQLKTKKRIYYSNGVTGYRMGLMVPVENYHMAIEQFSKVGIIRGFTPHPIQPQIDSGQIKLTYSDSMTALLNLTLAKRVEGALVNVDVARHHLNNKLLSDDQLLFNDELPFTGSKYHLSTKRYPKLIEALDVFLKEHKSDVQKLKQRFNLLL